MKELQFKLIRFMLKVLGLKLGLKVYNAFATDAPKEEEAPQSETTSATATPTATTGPIKTPASYDISHWKVVNNWDGIQPTPILMGTKATQGTSYKDPTFPEYFQNFTSRVHCRRLAYHFFEKTMDPVKQADWFCDYIAPYVTAQDVLCLDFEQGGETASQLWAWIDRVNTRYPINLVILYSRKNLADPIVMNESEKAFFKSYPFWVAGYPTDPSPYNTTPSGYIPDQTKWGPVWLWQYTDSGRVTGIDGDTDCNLVEVPFQQWLGAPPPSSDTVTYPYTGVQRIEGRRFNSDIYVTILEVAKVRVQVVHETPFDNGLFFPSQACLNRSAQFAWNGDEWDKSVPLPAFPKNLAVSDTQVYVKRSSAEPSLIAFSDNTVNITHTTPPSIRQASTGRRYLIENGVIKDYLSGNEPQYTERHPRGLTGITADKSKIIMVTVDGRTDISTGVTLKEGAQILKEFGAYTAFDRGGGGDAVDVMDGVVQNVPCDTDSSGQPGVERAVPQAILIYATEENNTMTSRYEATANGDNTRIRMGHDTSYPYKNSYPKGTKFQGNDAVNDANTVNGLFTAPTDLVNAAGLYQRKGDKWLAVKTVNGQPPLNMDTGQPIPNQTWVAIVHLGTQQICTLVDNGPVDPPSGDTPPKEVIVTDEAGAKWKATTFTKVV